MSVKEALQFIQWLRRPEAARDLRPADGPLTLEALTRIGAARGFVFSTEELRTAHRHEWGMRWCAVSRRGASPDDG